MWRAALTIKLEISKLVLCRVPEISKQKLSAYLHGVCRPYNGSRPVEKVPIGATGGDNGAPVVVVYENHPPLELPGTAREMFDDLTGRDRRLPRVKCADGKWRHPKVLTHAPEWPAIKAAANGKEITHHTVEEMICPCMRPVVTEKCAEPKMYAAQQMLQLYHKMATQLHREGDCQCGCTADVVGTDGVTRRVRMPTLKQFAASLRSAMSSILCPSVVIPELAINQYDSKTGLMIEDKLECKLRDYKCHAGDCSKCGWDVVFSALPKQSVHYPPGPGEPAGRTVEARGCSRDFDSTVMVKWASWQAIPTGTVAEGDLAFFYLL